MKKLLLTSTILFVGIFTTTSQIIEDALLTDAVFVSVSIDPSGNKYYSGSFDGTVDFDPGAGVVNLTGSDDGLDIFILKLNSSGVFQWVRHIEPQPSGTAQTSTFQEMDLKAHSSGVLMVANTLRPYDLDPSAGTFLTSNAQSSLSLVSLNTSGTFQFARNIESSTTNKSVFVSGVERKSNRDIVVIGGFGGTVDFDPGAGVQNETASASVADPYMLTLDENGDFVSVAAFPGGIGNFSDLILDSSDNVWVTGYQRGDMTINGKNFPVIGSTSNFLIQFDASNSALAAKGWGANGLGSFITIDQSTQDVYVASKFTIAADFDPGAGTTTLTPVSQDFAISKFNSFGSFQSVTQVSTSGFDTPSDIEMDGQSQLHVLSQTPFSTAFKLLYQVYNTNFTILREEEPAFTNIIYDMDIENFKMEWLANFTSTNNFDFCGGTVSITDPGGAAYDPFRAVYDIEEFADTPTIAASNTLVCGSGSVTLSISAGDLNDASNWQWYSGSCEGTPVGTGTSVMVSPSVTTTYYVGGEGYTCNSVGDCASVTITVSDAPTDISISMSSVSENQAIGTSIGTFSSTDLTPGDTHTYSFASGTGDTDNASFNLVGNELRTAEVFDFESKNSYSIRIESEDILECTFQKVFIISVGDVTPEAPTDIVLSSSSINENNSINLVVGTFSTTDDDTGETYSYTLVSGTGSTDNSSFNINGNDLRASESFDFETKNSYSIRVRTDDGNSGIFEKQFTISVNNVLETGNDILSFSVPGQIGSSVIDDVNHTVQFDMGIGADLSNLTPAITASSGATTSPLSGASQNFSSTVSYTVTAENGAMQSWDVTATTKIPAGTYTIGGTADYSSVLTGLAAVRDNGISGDVVFEIEDGYTDTWSSSLTFDDFDGTETYTVTITVADGASSATITDSGASLIARGVKNITIDGKGVLEFQSSGAVSTAILIFVFNSGKIAENIQIKDTKFSSQRVPISFSSAANVSVSGCEFSFLDNSATYKGFFSSMRLITVDGADIYNNKIQYSGAFDHLGAATNGEGKIHGIDLQTGGSDISIYNNSIYLNPVNARNTLGINVGPAGVTGSLLVDHNTIVIEGTNSVDGVSEGILAKVNGSSDVLRVRNNIVTILRNNGNANETGIGYSKPTDFTVSNNNIFITDDAGIEDYANSFEISDLPALLLEAPGTTVTQATFTNTTTGDLTLSGTSLSDPDFRGIPVATVTTDLNGISRNVLVPSRGAYETSNNITDILSMTFTEISGSAVVDDVNHTVNASATLGSNLTALSPSFGLFAGASISPNSGTTRDFTNTVSYTVTAEDASTQMWDVNIVEENGPPTDIQLASTDVDEKSAPGTVVGFFSTTDPNSADSHTYSLVSGTGDADNSAFNIFGNNIRTAFVFDFETKSSYSIRVQSDDQNGGTFEEQFTITVNDVNDAPTDASLSASSVEENLPVGTTVGTLSTVDQDAGDTHTYTFKPGTPDNDFFTIDGDQLKTGAVFDFETKSIYNLEIFTNDGNGGQFEEEFAVTIIDEPTVISNINISNDNIDENDPSGTTIGMFGTQGTELLGIYSYSLVSGTGDDQNALFTIDGDELKNANAFDFESLNSASIRVRSTGVGGAFDKVFTININNVFEAPTDLLLSSQDIDESSPVGTEVGILSTTDEDNGESYTYTLVSGTGDTDNSSFSISGNELRAGEVFDFETKTSYSVRVQTNDGNGGIFHKAFTITINDQPPGLTGVGITSSSIDENQSSGSSVGDLFALGDEIAGVSFTFTLVSGTGDTDNGSFTISTDELLTTASFDFESKSQYSIRVMANDGAGSMIDQVLLIDVNDVNEAPTDIMLSANDIDENDAINENIGTLSSTDVDAGSTHTYSFVSGTGDTDNGSFNISGNSLRASESFNFETKSSYTVRIQTNDGNGGLYEEAFTIIINDVSEAPTDLSLSANNIDENNGINAVIGSLSTTDEDTGETYTYSLVSGSGDTDNASFNISGNQLRASDVFDFETQNVYNVRIQTDDGNGGIHSENYTLAINDLNEAPTDISLSNNSIEESNPIGTFVGSLSSTDEDNGQSHSYSLVAGTGDTDNVSFSISGSDLVSAEVFDFETRSSYSVRIQSNDGNGGTFEKAFTITVNDLPASVTSFNLSNQTINENEVVNTVVGSFSTSGEDLSGSFTYSLVTGAGDTDNAAFIISGDELLSGASFDFETKNAYSVRVMTDDGTGNTSEAVFSINVNDVSEAPTDISLDASTLAENNSINDVIGSFSTTDQDAGESFSYSLVAGTGDSDNTSFNINGADLQASDLFDFEIKSNYSIRVQTNDGNGGLFEKSFSITIIDENESILLVSPISDLVLDEGFSSQNIDVSSVFSDQDGDALTYNVMSSNTSIVTVTNSGANVTIAEAGGFGSSTITVTADDGSGITTSDDFVVTVNEVFSTETDITAFSLTEQTGPAAIGASNHSVNIEVVRGTAVTNLNPTVEVSPGATYSPTGGQNFANGSVIYTVTAEDRTTSQDWMVTVTIEPNTETDILTFALAEETGPATIDATNHTVSIEVAIGTDVTSLAPTITISEGATISHIGAQDFTSAVTYTVTAEDGTTTQDWVVTITVEPEPLSDATDITAFSFSEQTGAATIDAVNHTVTIEVSDGTDITSLTPTITVSDGASVSPSGAQDFSTSVIYTITAEDGSTTQDWTIAVTVEPSLGLEEEIQIDVYPNPTSDFVRVISDQTLTVKVVDLRGMSITKPVTGNNVTIDVRSLSQGNYLLQIIGEEITTARRFIKIN